MRQLPLGWRWPAQQRFETFHASETNGPGVAALRRAALEAAAPWVFIAGPVGCGKTHLLIAACSTAQDAGRVAQYISLRNRLEPEMLRDFGGSDVLALDDVDAIAGDIAVEHALFDLYNRSGAEGATLVFAATVAPHQLGLRLPDLVSRLSSAAQASLKVLDDDERRAVLRRRAEARGMVLDEIVLDFLFSRYARDLASLGALLDRLDRESLAAQRRITVPFLRGLLGGES